MRQIILDTETTGLEPAEGHRVIEIGCVELVDRKVTENRFHTYLNPEREIEAGAFAVHGITNDKLAGEPRFADIADDFLAFVDGAELVIHNAPFDVAFINLELKAAGIVPADIGERCDILDTLVLARRMHPGQKNSLDALCRRYGIDNSQRTLHGALLDAMILADVYLAMSGGQAALGLDAAAEAAAAGRRTPPKRVDREGLTLVRVKPTASELEAHAELVRELGDGAAWK